MDTGMAQDLMKYVDDLVTRKIQSALTPYIYGIVTVVTPGSDDVVTKITATIDGTTQSVEGIKCLEHVVPHVGDCVLLTPVNGLTGDWIALAVVKSAYAPGTLLDYGRIRLPGADSNIGPDSAAWHAIQDVTGGTLEFTYTPPVDAFIVVNLIWVMSAAQVDKRVEFHIWTTRGAGYQSEGRIVTPNVAQEDHYNKTFGIDLPAGVACTFSPMYYNVDSNTISTKAADHTQLCWTAWKVP